MKTKLLPLILLGSLLVGISSTGLAQKNVLKINPLSLALLTGNVQYERALNEAMSVQLGLFYTGFSFSVEGSDRVGYSGIGITPEFRYYVSNATKDAPRGVYLGPYLRYRNFQANVRDDASMSQGEWELSSIGGGLILGYQWLFGDAFALDIYLGPGLRNNTTRVIVNSPDIDEGDLQGFANGFGVLFRFGISVGAAF